MAKSQRSKGSIGVRHKRRKSMKRPELLDRLKQVGGDELAAFGAWVLEHAPKHQLKTEWGDAGPMLKYVDEDWSDKVFKFGQLEVKGVFGQRKGIFGQHEISTGNGRKANTELQRAGREYLQAIASLMGAEVKTFKSPRGHVFDAVVVGDRHRDWPPLATLVPKKELWFAAIDEAIRKIRRILGPGGGNRGQGLILDSATRKAIEDHAMKMAIAHYERAGYRVQDTSRTKPYDLVCTRGTETFRVEVKGTQSAGETVVLTIAEVDNARNRDIRTDLFVVGMIQVTKTPQGSQATGGKLVCHIERWIPDDDDLTATEFKYAIPR